MLNNFSHECFPIPVSAPHYPDIKWIKMIQTPISKHGDTMLSWQCEIIQIKKWIEVSWFNGGTQIPFKNVDTSPATWLICCVVLGSFDALLSEGQPNFWPLSVTSRVGTQGFMQIKMVWMPIIPWACLFRKCVLYSLEEAVRIHFMPWKTGLDSVSK